MAVLDRADDVLSYEQVRVIVAWARSLPCELPRCPPATREDEEVAMRLVRDRRLPDVWYNLINVYKRNPTLVVDNFDLFLDEMEARGANSTFSNMIGVVIARLDDTILRSRGDRLLALIRASDWRSRRGMGIISGRLGLDTTALISERLGNSESAETAALAACLADEAIGRELVPSLLAYLRAPVVSKPGVHTVGRPLAIDRYVLRALARFGHFEEAKDLFVSLHPPPYSITTNIAYELERAAELAGDPSLGSRQSAPAPAPAPAPLNDVNPCYGGYLRP
jgi:hypothetical protein